LHRTNIYVAGGQSTMEILLLNIDWCPLN